MLDSELKSKINLLWNKFWSGGISNPLQAIEQMSYLIFMKRLEDEEVSREQNAKLLGDRHVSIFKGNKDCKWSRWTEMSAEQMLEHVRDNVFPFLRKLNGGEKSVYSKYMKNSTFSMPTASLLVEAVKIINDMHIKEQNRDTKGDLYEYLLGQLQTAGKNGQFRTPRHIIKMMVELLDPKYGDRICDPACGTAGFLVAAFEHVLKNNTSSDLVKEGNFAGDKLDEMQWKILRDDTLFLELMFNLLTNGGRCAVILPDGVLFGNSKAHKKIRELVLDKCRLDAVISMPSGVFKPYAGVSTAVLFFTKGEPTKEVWFYNMEADGFSLDDKRTAQPDKNDIPDIIEQFKKRHKEKPTDRKKKCFFVPVKEIKENNYDLSISKYKEIEYEEVKYEKPDIIKTKIIDLENKIAQALKELEI